jgi:GH15 family glucan-1,4-alpha-glucosidase
VSTTPLHLQDLAAVDGYLPIADHGLVGDGRGSALVGRDGRISFMCVPRFDAPPLFCGLLDAERGGGLLLAPDGVRRGAQRYLEDTGVLVTELASDDAVVELTDAFVLARGAELEHSARAATGELVRRARVLHGDTPLRVVVRPRGGADFRRAADGWRLTCPHQGLRLSLRSSHPLDGAETVLRLRQGEEFWLALAWDEPEPGATIDRSGVTERIEDTVAVWRRWAERLPRQLPRADLVRRSAITLKMLEHIENGAIIAAPTSSLPERIGGVRNWDYRYTWMRDAAYAVFAQRRIGLPHEAERFLAWVLDVTRLGDGPQVLYGVDGRAPQPETVDEELSGYRGSAPVRWGNGAMDQQQHDIYGEIMDCAFHWGSRGGRISAPLWKSLSGMARLAQDLWNKPDQSIWEVRSAGRPFTYSAAMCQVALDRAARLAGSLNLPGDVRGWAREAGRISEHVLHEAWDDRRQAFTEHLGEGGGLDASVLTLPLRRVIPADHPRMVATTRAVARELDAGGGLIYRYLPGKSPDGFEGSEGAFMICCFWLVDNLAGQGRVEEANELFERLCSHANPLGLLSEEVDPSDGSLVGNFPQGLSHVGLISSAVILGRISSGLRPELFTHARFGHV